MTRKLSLIAAPLLSATLLFSGCASLPSRPIVDEAPSAQLDADFQDCYALAQGFKANNAPVKNAAISNALTGAAIGGIEDAWDGALVGALLGGLFGTVQGKATQANATSFERDRIVRQCLAGRGHRVIG